MSHRRVYSGGSYLLLNSGVAVSVRPLRYTRLGAISELSRLQPFDRRNSTSVGFRRSPERSSGPILIYYDGYYPWANSIDVRPLRKFAYEGSYPMLIRVLEISPAITLFF